MPYRHNVCIWREREVGERERERGGERGREGERASRHVPGLYGDLHFG